MIQTTYTVDTGRTVFQTTDAQTADQHARQGHRVTASTTDQSDPQVTVL